MDDLVKFLKARYDEAVAPRVVPTWHEPFCLSPSGSPCFYCGAEEDPAKVKSVPAPPEVLVDIESKRRILGEVVPEMNQMDDQLEAEFGTPSNPEPYESERLLRLLALPYTDHPDYQEAWRP